MRASLAIGALLLLGACDSGKPYPDLPDKNLRVQTASTDASVRMEVYGLAEGCGAEYQGTVVLLDPVVHVGLPALRRSRLVFEFRGSGLFERTSLKKVAEIVPRPGFRYDARIAYRDGVYSVELREIDPQSGEVRDLDPIGRC